jgi:hypothetical protein
VIADEDAFKRAEESDRVKQEKIRKEQENVDWTREQNARRKMDNIQSREWDSGKPSVDWRKQVQDERGMLSETPLTGGGHGGSSRGRGKGRGRGTKEGVKRTEMPTEPAATW